MPPQDQWLEFARNDKGKQANITWSRLKPELKQIPKIFKNFTNFTEFSLKFGIFLVFQHFHAFLFIIRILLGFLEHSRKTQKILKNSRKFQKVLENSKKSKKLKKILTFCVTLFEANVRDNANTYVYQNTLPAHSG